VTPAARLRGPQLYSLEDIDRLDALARHAQGVLARLLKMCQPGARPRSLPAALRAAAGDERADTPMEAIRDHAGRAFGWPCAVSVDDAAAHAPPPAEPLRQGQVVTVDLMLARDGWHADLADTVLVGGGPSPLLDALDAVWRAALARIAPGAPWSDVANAMARAADDRGHRLVRGLACHGIGRAAHELPVLPLTPLEGEPLPQLRPGLVLTLEPAVTSGAGELVRDADGWTLRTADGAPAAARERMVAVGESGCRLLGLP